MPTPEKYAQDNASRFINELKDLLSIPSISTTPENARDVRHAAEWLRDHALSIGMQRAEIHETGGHPIVYAEWLGAGKNAPTVMVYGHYDVQPVDDPRNEWQTPPFQPTERNGNLYARGATDDKGQTFIHLKAFESIMKAQGSFPVNIKMMIEGEEEMGSRNLPHYVEKNRDLLACDMVVISDTHIISPAQPSLVYGLRGMIYMELEVFGPATDLHSGSFGGAVHNPAQALAEIVAQLHNPDGSVRVRGFYDDVIPLTQADRQAIAKNPQTEADVLRVSGAPKVWGEHNYTVHERIGARPTLEINGLVGGWTGEGQKTVIGKSALAKISCRLVPDQDPDKTLRQIQDYVASITPDTVRSEVRMLGEGTPGALVPVDSEAMQLAAAAYEATFGVEPILTREGGSIPVVALYQQLLDIPVLLMGFGLPDDNLHAPNEKMTLSMFHKGVQTMLHFYQNI